MTGPLFIKTQIIDYDNDASEIECKINWSSLRWILLLIDKFVEMKKATSMLETSEHRKNVIQVTNITVAKISIKITLLFKYKRLQKAV